jgi:hypothetical protein
MPAGKLPRSFTVSSRRAHLPVLAALLLCLISGCQTTPWQGFPTATQANLVWPPPPETPRVAYVMQIRRHQDLFSEAVGWHFIQHLLAGPQDSQMSRPFALALHPEGGLLVSDPGRNCVHYYCWSRQRYVAIGAQLAGGLPSPVGVAALPDGRILVGDSKLGHLESFAADGKSLGPFGALDLFKRPAGMAVDPATQRVYIADVSRHEIVVLDFAGKLILRFGARGAGNGQFNFPTHLALTPEGNLAISDALNFRVQIISPDGKFIGKFGESGDSPGHFSKMKGIACDRAGHIISVESLYGFLQFFDAQGQFLLNLGGSGSAPGQFWLPSGLCYDPQQQLLFVADSYNSRVQVFRMMQDSTP